MKKKPKIVAQSREKPEIDYDLFNVDKFKLADEWDKQPRIFMRHAAKMADCREALERASAKVELRKDEVKRVFAELFLKIAKDPDGYQMPKTSDDTFKNAVLIQPAYITAQKLLRQAKAREIEAQYDYDIARAYVDALQQRKVQLENQVYLHGQGYFAYPKKTHGMSEVDKNATLSRLSRPNKKMAPGKK